MNTEWRDDQVEMLHWLAKDALLRLSLSSAYLSRMSRERPGWWEDITKDHRGTSVEGFGGVWDGSAPFSLLTVCARISGS